jgi:hypothetical protein
VVVLCYLVCLEEYEKLLPKGADELSVLWDDHGAHPSDTTIILLSNWRETAAQIRLPASPVIPAPLYDAIGRSEYGLSSGGRTSGMPRCDFVCYG